MNEISILQVAIDQLNPAKYNPRKWDEQAKRNLKESLKRFGFIDPVIVNGAIEKKNTVIGGHFRLAMAKELGYKEVPAVFVNIQDEQKEKELNLRLNRNTGECDLELLKEFDVDLLMDVGFDDIEFGEIWDENLNLENDEFQTEKELEKITNPETKIGDVFQIGKHRLICGDSTDPKVIEKLVGKEKIDIVYTDPPYNISYDYQKGLGGKQKYDCEKVDDRKSRKEYEKFLEKTLKNAKKYLKKDSHIFYFCDQKYIGVLQNLYFKNGVDPKRVCLWIKNAANPTPQIAFNKIYEPCVYGTVGNPFLNQKSAAFSEMLNPEIGNGNRGVEDILDMLDIWLVKKLPTNGYLHPTEKPVELHERPLKRCTRVGDAVIDLFGGSGSTLIACEQLKRKAFLAEKDPAFCDLIIKRFKTFNPNSNVKKIN